jgi:hypothetical protein
MLWSELVECANEQNVQYSHSYKVDSRVEWVGNTERGGGVSKVVGERNAKREKIKGGTRTY